MEATAGSGDTDALYARIVAATADTAYRPRRTERGFDLTVDVPQSTRRVTQVHTYRVALVPGDMTFTMTDVVRTREQGLAGAPGTTTETGRARYRTWGHSPVSGERFAFSSADGHRLIRGAAEELGWRELRPASQQTALVFGAIGGAIALGTLIALAVVFWP
ncbi:hypothetical protein ABZV77_11950 [Streptomyces sp. NPDC004732]|uniref:hypothetical protein n=1 Tax=Streptomyces sp. NPDC004732 TaxID=3154290 RepID=UPI0033BC74FA